MEIAVEDPAEPLQAGETDPLAERGWDYATSYRPGRIHPCTPAEGTGGSNRCSDGSASTLAALSLLGVLCGTVLSARAQQGAPPPPDSFRPLYPEAAPVRTPESLSSVALPDTTIDSVTIDPTDGSCRVTATVTHPPAADRIQVFIALPMKGWNGRFIGTGGGGFAGGSPRSLAGRVSQGFAAGATDTGHEGGRGALPWTRRAASTGPASAPTPTSASTT